MDTQRASRTTPRSARSIGKALCTTWIVASLLMVASIPATAETETPAERAPHELESPVEQPGSTTETSGDTFERAIRFVEPSVVYLDVTVTGFVHDGEEWLGPYEIPSSCSGTIIDSSGHVLTAGHCVDPSSFRRHFIGSAVAEWVENAWIDTHEVEDLFAIAYDNWVVEGVDPASSADVKVTVAFAASASGLQSDQWYRARVVDFTSMNDGDVALLKVEREDLPAVELAPTTPAVGASIVAAGFPVSVDHVTDPDLNAAYKDGRISQHRTRGDGSLPVWEISAAVSGGMSGGPTFDLDGRIVGVNSFGIRGEEQQFNFVSPVQLVRELAARNGLTLELDAASAAYREGVTSLYEQDHASAVAAFETVLDLVPSHAKASELLRMAKEGLRAQQVEGPSPPEAAALAGGTDGAETDPGSVSTDVRDPSLTRAASSGSATPRPLALILAVLTLTTLGLGTAVGIPLARRNRRSAAPAERRPMPPSPPGGAGASTFEGEHQHSSPHPPVPVQ